MSMPLTWSKTKYTWSKNLTWNGQAPTNNNKMNAHVSLAYKKKKEGAIIPFAQGVHDGLGSHATLFTTLPVTLVAQQSAITDYTTKYNAAQKGSVAQTEAKTLAYTVLIGLLNQLAAYVEGVAQGNPDTIRAAGFEPIERTHVPSVPPVKPELKSVVNIAAGKLQLHVTMQPNIHSILVEYRTGAGNWASGGAFSSGRKIVIAGLTPGVVYDFRVAFVGGNDATSEWSDLVTHLCA